MLLRATTKELLNIYEDNNTHNWKAGGLRFCRQCDKLITITKHCKGEMSVFIIVSSEYIITTTWLSLVLATSSNLT